MNALEAQAPAVEATSTASRSIRSWATFGALGLLFLVATNGPVFWIRLDRGILTEPLLDDVWVQLGFVVPTALVLVLAAPSARTLWTDRAVTIVFAGFALVVLASSTWALNPQGTLEQTAMFVLTTAAALLAGAYVRRFDALAALWLAMQVGVGISVFAWVREWEGIFGGPNNEFFAGIYLHKNSLGPVATIGVMTSIVLGVAAWRRRIWWLVPLVAIAMPIDALVALRSKSYSSAFAWPLAAAVALSVVLMVPGPRARLRRAVGTACIAGIGLLIALALLLRDELTDWLGRREFLSGRTRIWEVVLDYARERPLSGWGFMSVWSQPDIAQSLIANKTNPVFQAHSGFLEVLLGVGAIGLVLLFAACGLALARTGTALWRAPTLMAAWSLALVVYVLVVNLTESFIGPNLLPWVLLCLATGQAVRVLRPAPGGRPTRRAPAAAVVADRGPVDATPARADAADEDWFDFSFDRSDGLDVDIDVDARRDLAALVTDGAESAGDGRRSGDDGWWDDGWHERWDDRLDDATPTGGDASQGGRTADDGWDGWR